MKVLGVMYRKLNHVKDILLAVMYNRSRLFFYKSTCIEMTRTKQYHSDTNLNDRYTINIWNEDDYAFDHQLEKWGVDKAFKINHNLLQDNRELILRIGKNPH